MAKKTKAGKKTTASKTKSKSAKTKRAKTKKSSSASGKKTVKKTKKASTKKGTAKKATKKTAAKKATKKAAKKAAKKTSKTKKTASAKSAATTKKKTAKKAKVTNATKTTRKKVAAKKTAELSAVQLVAEEETKVPSLSQRIASKDLRQIKNSLLERRRQLIGSIGAFESEYLGTSDNRTTTGGDEADQAASAMVADLNLRLAESETQELKDIQDALLKIQDGSYGICEVTGQPIDVRRLLARPSARLSIEAQRDLEAQKLYFDERVGWVMQDDYGSF